MNEHERLADPAFDRLVAADPARRTPDPVPGVLRAKVDALIAEQEEQRPAGSGRQSGPAGREQADELALRRYRRRTPWLVAAAVVGILAAGGGGFVAGESGLGAAPTADMASEERAADAPSVMAGPDRAEDDSGEGTAESEGVEPLGAGGELPTSTGFVFHAGAGLSETATAAEVRVAGTSGESLGSYPVVSQVEAVERLADPRFAGAVLGRPDQESQDNAGPSATPEPGGPVAWPVEDVTIRSANLVEARYTLPDGTVLLVPAYDLVDAEGRSWTVMAVGEELLDFTP